MMMKVVVVLLLAYVTCVHATIQDDVDLAAHAYWGTPSVGDGSYAAAIAVNNVIKLAGYKALGVNPGDIGGMESSLINGRGHLIPERDSAVPGDLVIDCHLGTIGVCVTRNCRYIVLNSDRRSCFCWQSSMFDFTQYYGCAPRIYRLDN